MKESSYRDEARDPLASPRCRPDSAVQNSADVDLEDTFNFNERPGNDLCLRGYVVLLVLLQRESSESSGRSR